MTIFQKIFKVNDCMIEVRNTNEISPAFRSPVFSSVSESSVDF